MRPASTAYTVFTVLKEVRVARLRDLVKATGLEKYKVFSALKTLQKRGLVRKEDGIYILISDVWS